MTQEQWSKVVSIIISAAIAIAAVFGYNIFIAQPQFAALEAQLAEPAVGPVAASRAVNAGDYVESLWVDKEFTSAGTNTFTGPLQGASPLVFEGATADAYETTFAVTDPTADRTFTFPNSSGTVALNPAAGTWEFEGTTADDYETTLTITDPTADRTVTIPNETGAVVMSSLATNATDAANSVTGQSNALRFEGATADGFETALTLTDPTADRTITLPNVSGTVMLTSNPGIMVVGVNTITNTLTISHGLTTPQAVFCTLVQDAEANNASCSATISGDTVVVKTWKADGATPGSVGKLVSWIVTGQP